MKILRSRAIVFAIVLVSVFLSAGSCYAKSGLSDSIKAEIKKISAAMYESGNLNYIDADALCDGLIKPEVPYTIDYNHHGSFTIHGGSRVSAVTKRAYAAKLHTFLQQQHTVYDFSTKSDGLKLADVFNSSSTFRSRSNPVNNHGIVTDNKKNETIDKLVALLCTDKLIDPLAGYHIKLSPEGIFANGYKLDELRTQQYLQSLATVDHTINKDHIPYLEVTFKLEDGQK